jgi:hypothetical protein
VSKFYDIAPGRIQLRKDSGEARARIVKAGGKLKEKAAHARTKKIGDVTKVADQRPPRVPAKRLTCVMSSDALTV